MSVIFYRAPRVIFSSASQQPAWMNFHHWRYPATPETLACINSVCHRHRVLPRASWSLDQRDRACYLPGFRVWRWFLRFTRLCKPRWCKVTTARPTALQIRWAAQPPSNRLVPAFFSHYGFQSICRLHCSSISEYEFEDFLLVISKISFFLQHL